MTDIAPTLSSLCKVPYPNACTGEPLIELFRNQRIANLSLTLHALLEVQDFFSHPFPRIMSIGSGIEYIFNLCNIPICLLQPARGTETLSLTASIILTWHMVFPLRCLPPGRSLPSPSISPAMAVAAAISGLPDGIASVWLIYSTEVLFPQLIRMYPTDTSFSLTVLKIGSCNDMVADQQFRISSGNQ